MVTWKKSVSAADFTPCTCSPIYLNDRSGGASGAYNWTPECLEHGTNSTWYNLPEQIIRRSEERLKTVDLQRRAREARLAFRRSQ